MSTISYKYAALLKVSSNNRNQEEEYKLAQKEVNRILDKPHRIFGKIFTPTTSKFENVRVSKSYHNQDYVWVRYLYSIQGTYVKDMEMQPNDYVCENVVNNVSGYWVGLNYLLTSIIN